MDLKELQKLIQLCRKHNVLSIKLSGVELTLSEEAPAPAKPRGKSSTAKASQMPLRDKEDLQREITEEDLLLWSSNYRDFLPDGV